jgi:hypothetical protein
MTLPVVTEIRNSVSLEWLVKAVAQPRFGCRLKPKPVRELAGRRALRRSITRLHDGYGADSKCLSSSAVDAPRCTRTPPTPRVSDTSGRDRSSLTKIGAPGRLRRRRGG